MNPKDFFAIYFIKILSNVSTSSPVNDLKSNSSFVDNLSEEKNERTKTEMV